MAETLSSYTPADEQAKILHQAADLLAAHADKLRGEVETYDRNLGQIRQRSQPPGFARLSDTERDRLRDDLKGLFDRVDFVARQIRHHRRTDDPDSPVNYVGGATDARYQVARDAQLVADAIDRLSNHATIFGIQPPDWLGADNTERQDVLGSIADQLRQWARDRHAAADQTPRSRKGY